MAKNSELFELSNNSLIHELFTLFDIMYITSMGWLHGTIVLNNVITIPEITSQMSVTILLYTITGSTIFLFET